MHMLGCAFGLLAALAFLVGIVPFFGWLNWITTLPLAVIAAALAYAGMRNRPGDGLARFTLIASLLLIIIALARLSIGGGVV